MRQLRLETGDAATISLSDMRLDEQAVTEPHGVERWAELSLSVQ
jgi:hypothetical protein